VVVPFAACSSSCPNPTMAVTSLSPWSTSPSRVNTRVYPPLEPCSHTMKLFTPCARHVSSWAISSSVQSSRIAALATRKPNRVDGVPLTRSWLPCTETVVCDRLGAGAGDGCPGRSAGAQAAIRPSTTSTPANSGRIDLTPGR
jgi:hypothetical protein